MYFKTLIAMKLAACVAVLAMTGCNTMPFDMTPDELRSRPASFHGTRTVEVPFNVFLENAHLAKITCGDSLHFMIHPDNRSASAIGQMAGLTTVATLFVVDAKQSGEFTELSAWSFANNEAWKKKIDGYIQKAVDPGACSKTGDSR